MKPAIQQIDVDEAGLPTVTGYRQLYAIALERLAADEQSWPPGRRERVAKAMTEAYCRGAVEGAQQERQQREQRATARREAMQDTLTLPLPLIDAPPADQPEVADVG
jgi:hypothetical protein